MPPSERPWELLAELAAAIGDPALSRLALAGYERDQAPTARIRRDAARITRATSPWPNSGGTRRSGCCARRTPGPPWISVTRWRRSAGRTTWRATRIRRWSTIEKFLATRDGQPDEDARWRARTHRWLGELYEAKGETRQAIEQYARFVELWAGADSELQPQVTEVRGRLERLRAGVG